MQIAEKIRQLGGDIDSMIYHTKHYDATESVWLVQLKHVKRSGDSRLQIEVTAEDADLETALENAWAKFENALADLAPIKLLPAIENSVTVALIGEAGTGKFGAAETEPSSHGSWCTVHAELGCTTPPCETCPLKTPKALDDEIPF